MKAVIGVKDLTRKFGHLLAVDHLEFEVYQSEIFGFLGPMELVKRPPSVCSLV